VKTKNHSEGEIFSDSTGIKESGGAESQRKNFFEGNFRKTRRKESRPACRGYARKRCSKKEKGFDLGLKNDLILTSWCGLKG